MRGSKHYLAGLSTLHQLEGADEVRATFRQSMATLAEATVEARGVPLEGMNPEQLLLSVRAAMTAHLLDDLSFLSPSGAACALYGLASSLPLGRERRELGRRVLVRLHEGDATTFVALAATVALGSTRAFEGQAMRARVALSLVLPIGTGAPADELALTLISRRELAQRWLVEPSTGSLPARRMAARLLERAAREATRRAVQGDEGVLAVFDTHAVRAAWAHLMTDREPLVWRHVATARGLLSLVQAQYAEELEQDLVAPRSLSRSRRGAASLAARLAHRPMEAVARAKEVLNGPLLARDPGVASAMIYGLPRAAEVEPEAAEELLRITVERGGALAAEALLDLRREWFGTEFGLKAAEIARVSLRQRYGRGSDDDGQAALIDLLCEELGEQGGERELNLPDAIFNALTAFATESARKAYELARVALTMAERKVSRLAELDEQDGPAARIELFRIIHELDAGLLEGNALADLLSLGAQGNDTSKAVAPLHALMAKLTRALMAKESEPHRTGENVPHLTLRVRRLRTLLHLLDAELREPDEKLFDARVQRMEDVRTLCERVQRDQSSAMDRVVHAALARGCDSLVRAELFELSDVLLSAANHVVTPEGFAALSESSMLPEVKPCLAALSDLVRTLHATEKLPKYALVDALNALTQSLPAESAPRTEGLRVALSRLTRGLAEIEKSRSLRELELARRCLELLELGIEELGRLSHGARRRLGVASPEGLPTSGHGMATLGLAIERALQDDDRTSLELALETLNDSLREELPRPLAATIMRVLKPVLKLPVDAPQVVHAPRPSLQQSEDRPLPGWLPPSRTLGGFFVQRALGAGAGGSVFAVKRTEERNDAAAPSLALKVPEYDGSAARSLSEEEFLRMFRQEAGAMLAVPSHRNLASFVTFDAGAKPKPILVMELVEGATLERTIARGDVDVRRALALVDGMAAGLEAMHSVGVGHLGIKPSNVILREQQEASTPVLVDFGLSGRHLRPGCATGNYGAPEIWGLVPEGALATPMAADVYALGCVAFELFTGRTLFEGSSEMALIAAHVSHDGAPAGVESLLANSATRPLGEWLAQCLRQDPRKRATVSQLRAHTKQLALSLSGLAWPIACT